MAATNGSEPGSKSKEEIDLEEMLKNMELMDEELDEVVIGEEDAKRFESEAR